MKLEDGKPTKQWNDPQLSTKFGLITKDATDQYRQEQMNEIISIRDYLARPQAKKDEKDKVNVNIPLMKTFERAILMPSETQHILQNKAYPDAGSGLMINPFPKKKAKKGKKKGKKKK